jgi:adenine-specific DNA methylase
VKCESPNCGAEIPLVRSFWLCKKANRKKALRTIVEPVGAALRGRPDHGQAQGLGQAQGPAPTKTVRFEIFEPKSDKDVPPGTVTRARATCLCCGTVLAPERVRAQLAAQRGGADVIFDAKARRTGGARLLTVVTLKPGEQGRHYRLPTERDYEAVRRAQERLAAILEEWERGGRQGLCPVPDEPLPPIGTLGFRVQRYGMLQWGDLFTARQKVALLEFGRSVARHWNTEGNERGRCCDLVELVALAASKRADYGSASTKWHLTFEKTTCTFGRMALPMTWDFVEPIPIGDASGAFGAALDSIQSASNSIAIVSEESGQLQIADATEHPLPDETAQVWFTDPPYYDAVPYADLSDFFLVWLKRALPGHSLLRDPFEP